MLYNSANEALFAHVYYYFSRIKNFEYYMLLAPFILAIIIITLDQVHPGGDAFNLYFRTVAFYS